MICIGSGETLYFFEDSKNGDDDVRNCNVDKQGTGFLSRTRQNVFAVDLKQIQGVNKVGQVYVSRREAAKNTTGG